LPHSHLVEYDVALPRDLVAVEIRHSTLDPVLREFPQNNTGVDRHLEERQLRFGALIALPE
jgi:hypothetical protein